MVMLLALGVWRIIHTEKFAQFTSREITKKLYERYNISVLFKNIQVEMLPPATILKDVQVSFKSTNDDSEYKIDMGTVGIYFGIIDLFSNEIKIKKIVLEDGQAIVTQSKQKKVKQSSLQEMLAGIGGSIAYQLPQNLKELLLKDVSVVYGPHSAWVAKAKLTQLHEKIKLAATLQNVQAAPIVKSNETLDSLELSAEYMEKHLVIKKLTLKKDLELIQGSGSVFETEKKWNVLGKISYQGSIKGLTENALRFTSSKLEQDDFEALGGLINIAGKIDGPLNDFKLSLNILVEQLKSSWAVLDNVQIGVTATKDHLKIEDLNAQKGEAGLQLQSPFVFYDFIKKSLFENKVRVSLDKMHSNTVLYFINDTMDVFKGTLSGDVDISFADKLLKISMVKGFSFMDFSLEIPDKDDNDIDIILQNPGLVFNKGEFFVRDDGNLKMDLDFEFEGSRIKSTAEIGDDKLYFKSRAPRINMEKFGPISGTLMHGVGVIDFEIKGPFEDVRFNFDAKLDNFSIIGFNLGKVESDITYSLRDKLLSIKHLTGNVDKTKFTGIGKIQFGKKEYLDLALNFKNASYKDSLFIYEDLAADLSFLPQNLKALYDTKYRVTGKLGLDELQVVGKITGHEASLPRFAEKFGSFALDFHYKNKILKLDKVSMHKGRGLATGNFKYNFYNKEIAYDAKLGGVWLSDLALYQLLNLGLDGEIQGEFYGNGKGDNFVSGSFLKVVDSQIGELSVKDSEIFVNNNGKRFFVSGKLMGDVVKVDSFLNLGSAGNKDKSHINASILSYDMKKIAGLLSGRNIKNYKLSGNVKANVVSTFSLNGWRDFNLLLKLENFVLKKGDVLLALANQNTEVIVKDGAVKLWDVTIGSSKDNIRSVGSGKFYGKLKIQNGFNINASVLDLVSSKIKRARGRLQGQLTIEGDREDYDVSLDGWGSKLMVKIEGLPDKFEEIDYRYRLQGNKLSFKDVKARYGQGNVTASGSVYFQFPFPHLDIKLKVNQTKVNIFDQSSLVLSGTSKIEGKSFPYKINSNLSVLHGEIFDEFDNISKVKKQKKGYERYLPEGTTKKNLDYLNYNFDLSIYRPVRIKNSLVDVLVNGSCKILGADTDPIITGNFVIAESENKLILRGQEFKLSEGQIGFNYKDGQVWPEFKFVGQANVKSYIIKLDTLGTINDYAIKLTSTPPLSREDILSLLTLGVTSEVTDQLHERDLQAITSLGLGSLIAERFKINQGLKSSLGLKISVSPEFSKEESTLLQSRSASTEDVSAKFKTSTKIKVQKNLAKDLDVSVSSTVGGTMEQKQEVNINYNFNNNFSLQGVYENKPDDDTEGSNSLGVDFKWRWSSK